MNTHNNYLNKVYNAGIYLRLSKEDETTGQSESIGNQKDYITKFVVENGWNIVDYYIDDGFSGLNFNRPSFKRMIKDVEAKKINLIITKDLSRLGRDYIDTGYYIERYFPQKMVRYIALNDGIDTFENNGNNDISPFKSVLNDMYAKDISKKVRSVMNNKCLNGEFIGAFAPYGYIKDPNNKNRFLVDPEASKVVAKIFQLFLNGESMRGIARKFNAEGIPCPAKYKQTHCNYKCAVLKKYLWTLETIKRILSNPTYIGSMTQHRQEKISYKIDKFKKIPSNDWIIVPNTHEPIISKEDFEIVQSLLSKNINHNTNQKNHHLLNGLVYCKDCGAKMTYRRNSSNKMIMQCSTYSKYGKEHCSGHRMIESEVEKIVIQNLKEISSQVLDKNFYDEFSDIQLKKEISLADNEIKRIEERLNEVKKIIKSLYEDKVKGIINEDLFIQMSNEFSEEKESLNNRYQELVIEKQNKEKLENINPIEYIKSIANFDKVNRTDLAMLIDKIYITEDKKIEIKYKFKTPKGYKKDKL